MSMAPLGPEGVRQRMEELRARMSQFALTQEVAPVPKGEFQSELAGEIGGASPFNPFASGVSLSGPKGSADVKALIQEAAANNNLDPALLDALVATESSYDPLARSRAGAMGLTQLMPATAKSLGVSNPFDPVQNVEGGAKYLSSMINRFGDLPTALAAYNAGPGAVERAGGIPNYKETQDYVQRVLARYEAARNQ